MAEAAPLSSRVSQTSKEYDDQYKIVSDQKEQNKVKPLDLYKLAALTARCDRKQCLPVCLLCQDIEKQLHQLGHIFPNSLLKAAGRADFFNYITGTSRPASRMGFKTFCPDCEARFEWGENHLAPKFYSPFLKEDLIRKVACKLDSGFPWLYFTLVSIIWRACSLCFLELNDQHVEVLESLRQFLLNYKKDDHGKVKEVQDKITRKTDQMLKLYILSPNKDIDKMLKDDQPSHRYFYDTFHAHFYMEPVLVGTEKKENHTGWLFMGRLHILFYYNSNTGFSIAPEESDELDCFSRLTAETEQFTIGNKSSRYFPEIMYKTIVDWGNDIMSATLRIKPFSRGQGAKPTEMCLEGQALHILPQNVSYDPNTNKFSFPDSIYKLCCCFEPHTFKKNLNMVKVTRGKKEEILFVAIPACLKNGGSVAMALSIDDHKLGYLKGLPPAHMQARINDFDITEPPFLEMITETCKTYNVFDTHGQSCPHK